MDTVASKESLSRGGASISIFLIGGGGDPKCVFILPIITGGSSGMVQNSQNTMLGYQNAATQYIPSYDINEEANNKVCK